MKKNRTLVIAVPIMIVLFGFFIYQYGYQRVHSDMASIKEEEAVKIKTLEKYINLISERPHLEKKITLLKEARKADDSKLIEAQTPSLAAAALQDTVKGIITGRGGTISSERVMKPEDLAKFKIISVSMDAVIPDSRALSDILYAIETRTPYLVVKEVDIRIRDYRNPRELIVKLDVSALAAAK